MSEVEKELQPRIVCAAVRLTYIDQCGKGQVLVIAGARHFDETIGNVMQALMPPGEDATLSNPNIIGRDSGFIDTLSRFHTRKEAWDIAVANNQILPNKIEGATPGSLTSEHLY